MTDRFFDGETSNDNLGGGYDPSDGSRVHGGDFQGLEEKLDYIAGLGVDTVWISPVVLNANGEYHDYAARGIYVILDLVTNHMGDLIGSFDQGYPDYDPSGGYQLSWWSAANHYDPPFDDLS